MYQKIELRKTRDFSTKINVTFEFIRQNFKGLCKSILYLSGGFILVGGLLASVYQQRTLAIAGRSLSTNVFENNFRPEVLGWLLGSYVFLLSASIITVLAVNEYVRLYGEKADPSAIEVAEVWEGVKRLFFKMLGASILAGFAIGFGLILLLVPGFYLMIVLSLLAPVMVFENKSVTEAFSRCFNLITEKWWSTFGLIFVTSIIVYFMSIVFSLPQVIFTLLFTFHAASGGVAEPPIWQQIGMSLATIVSYLGSNLLGSIIYIAIIFQFFNLVERKEAAGLMSKLESFGKTEQNAPANDETY